MRVPNSPPAFALKIVVGIFETTSEALISATLMTVLLARAPGGSGTS